MLILRRASQNATILPTCNGITGFLIRFTRSASHSTYLEADELLSSLDVKRMHLSSGHRFKKIHSHWLGMLWSAKGCRSNTWGIADTERELRQ